MRHAILWAVMIAECGGEIARIALPASNKRGQLPLRDLASEGLRHDAAAVVVVRTAADDRCIPCAEELGAIGTARQTLGAIGLRLHDYILWHRDRSVSLRATGQL